MGYTKEIWWKTDLIMKYEIFTFNTFSLWDVISFFYTIS